MTTENPADQNRTDLRAHARRLVADWPPLTEDQRARLAVLLRPVAPAAELPARKAA